MRVRSRNRPLSLCRMSISNGVFGHLSRVIRTVEWMIRQIGEFLTLDLYLTSQHRSTILTNGSCSSLNARSALNRGCKPHSYYHTKRLTRDGCRWLSAIAIGLLLLLAYRSSFSATRLPHLSMRMQAKRGCHDPSSLRLRERFLIGVESKNTNETTTPLHQRR